MSDSGKPARLRQIICSMRQPLYRTARAWCRDADLADDLAQDAVVKALTRVHNLRDEEALRGWVFTILNNCYRDWLRGHREHVDIDDLALPCSDCPETQAEIAERVAKVRRALGELCAEHRETITLVDLEGLTYKEASHALGLPMGTVMSRLSRGRIRLRSLFESTPSVDEQPILETKRSRLPAHAKGAPA